MGAAVEARAAFGAVVGVGAAAVADVDLGSGGRPGSGYRVLGYRVLGWAVVGAGGGCGLGPGAVLGSLGRGGGAQQYCQQQGGEYQ